MSSTQIKPTVKQSTHRAQQQTPQRYAVLLLNDDYTPMDFVVAVLNDVFFLPSAQAMAVMLLVHHQGRGVCGVYQKDVAETKCARVLALANSEGHPLKCVVEPA